MWLRWEPVTSPNPQNVCLTCGAPLPLNGSRCAECGAETVELLDLAEDRLTAPHGSDNQRSDTDPAPESALDRLEMFESIEGADNPRDYDAASSAEVRRRAAPPPLAHAAWAHRGGDPVREPADPAADVLGADDLPSGRLDSSRRLGDSNTPKAQGFDSDAADSDRFDPEDRHSFDDVDTDLGDEDEEAPTVPAGTWASTSVVDELAPRDADDTIHSELASESSDGLVRRARRDASESRTVQRVEARQAKEILARKKADERSGSKSDDTSGSKARAGKIVEFPAGRSAADDATSSRSGTKLKAESATSPEAEAPATAPAQSEAAEVPQPRWLASELLREAPLIDPYARLSRAIALFCGVAGTAVSMVFGTEGPFALGIAVLFASIAIISVTPLRFLFRGAGFALLSSLGVAASAFVRSETAGDGVGLAVLGATLLASALLLRGIQARSRFAQAGILLGVAIAVTWLIVGGGFDSMVIHHFNDLSFLQPISRMLLIIAVALPAFSFVDEFGPSGSRVWAAVALAWLLFEAAATIVIERHEITTLSAAAPDWLLATASAPLFAIVGAFGWAQVWATIPGLGFAPGKPVVKANA